MNERLQELLDAVQRTASQVGGSAADAAYGMGKRAGELLSVAKLNIRIMDLKGAVSTALREVGEMIYATHTGTLTESEVLLAKLQEIDGLRQQIDRLWAFANSNPFRLYSFRNSSRIISAGRPPGAATYSAGNAAKSCKEEA